MQVREPGDRHGVDPYAPRRSSDLDLINDYPSGEPLPPGKVGVNPHLPHITAPSKEGAPPLIHIGIANAWWETTNLALQEPGKPGKGIERIWLCKSQVTPGNRRTNLALQEPGKGTRRQTW